MKTILTIFLLFIGLCCTEAQDWTWSEDQLPFYARMGISAAVLDDSIFFSGGRIDEGSSFINIVEIYNVGEDEWYMNELSTPGQWLTSAVSANGMVFFAGGNNFQATNWHFFDEIDVFTKETGGWTVEHLSEPRGFLGAVAHGNKVFFAGGGAETYEIFYVIDIYDTETGFWSNDSLSVPRQWIGSAAAGGKVFFAGGNTTAGGNEVTDVIDIYDISNGDWTVEHLSEPRALTAAVSYGGKVYFAGGARANSTSCDVIDIYNVANSTWEDPIYLSSSRIVTALNVKNALVFTGICDNVVLNQGLYQNRNGIVDIYYPDTDQWDYTVPDLNPARFFYAHASYDNKAYYGGGWPNSGGATDLVNILEYPLCLPDGITFTTQAEIDNFQTNYPYCSEIGGDVEINGNDIANLDGLNFVTGIGGDLSIINCDNLTSLWGLENINSESIVDLSIYDNSALSDCDIWNICYYLNNTSGIVDIHGNATGCDTKEEVIEACLTSVDNISYVDELIISPNPCSGSVNLQFSISDQRFVILDLFEISGVKVKSILNEEKLPGTYELEIDLRSFSAGVYFCVLKTSKGIQTKKMIKL